MSLFRKKSKDVREAEQFTKEFTELIRQITSALNAAVSTEQAAPSLKMLEGLASYGMPEAKTFHGLAYLMDDKPWYDYGKGLAIMHFQHASARQGLPGRPERRPVGPGER